MLTTPAAPPFLSTASALPSMQARPTAPDAPAARPAAHPFAKMLRQSQAPAPAVPRQASHEPEPDPAAAEVPSDSPQIDHAGASTRSGRSRAGDKAVRAGKDKATKSEAAEAVDESEAPAIDSASSAPTPDPSVMQWLAERPLRAEARSAGDGADALDDKADPNARSGLDSGRLRGAARAAEQAQAADLDHTTARKSDDAVPASKTFAETVALHVPVDVPGSAMAAEAVRSAQDAESPAHRIDASAGTPAFSAATFTPAGSTLPAAAAPLNINLTTPLGAPDFAQVLGAQITVLASDRVQHAELHFHPAEMGPVSVQITLDGAHARIDFGADVAATRHVIENGLPELASALRDAGLTLTGGGVSPHARGRGESGNGSGAEGHPQRRGAVEAEPVAAPRPRAMALGGIDLYA